MTVREVLIQARKLYAAAPSHAPVGYACESGKECMVTAVCNAGGDGDVEDAALLALSSLVEPSLGLARFNANHSTEEVLDVFDQAIEATA